MQGADEAGEGMSLEGEGGSILRTDSTQALRTEELLLRHGPDQ